MFHSTYATDANESMIGKPMTWLATAGHQLQKAHYLDIPKLLSNIQLTYGTIVVGFRMLWPFFNYFHYFV